MNRAQSLSLCMSGEWILENGHARRTELLSGAQSGKPGDGAKFAIWNLYYHAPAAST
jgi:hypothetical protein